MPPVPQRLRHELAEVVGLLVGVRRHRHEGEGLEKVGFNWIPIPYFVEFVRFQIFPVTMQLSRADFYETFTGRGIRLFLRLTRKIFL